MLRATQVVSNPLLCIYFFRCSFVGVTRHSNSGIQAPYRFCFWLGTVSFENSFAMASTPTAVRAHFQLHIYNIHVLETLAHTPVQVDILSDSTSVAFTSYTCLPFSSHLFFCHSCHCYHSCRILDFVPLLSFLPFLSHSCLPSIVAILIAFLLAVPFLSLLPFLSHSLSGLRPGLLVAHGEVPHVGALHGRQGVGVPRRHDFPRGHGAVRAVKTPPMSYFCRFVGRDACQESRRCRHGSSKIYFSTGRMPVGHERKVKGIYIYVHMYRR